MCARLCNRRLLAAAILLLLRIAASMQNGSDTAAPTSRLLYDRILPDKSQELVIFENGSENESRFKVEAGQCYSFSLEQNLIAVSEQEQPSKIVVYELTTHKTVSQIKWQADWLNPCQFSVERDAILVVRILLDPLPRQSVVIDIPAAKILAQMPSDQVASLLTFGRTLRQSLVVLQNPVESLPDIVQSQPLYKLSPRPGLVLYQRCLGDIITGNFGDMCRVDYDFVVYDYEHQQEITVLKYPPYLRYDPRTDFSMSFHWSPDGRYIAYRADFGAPGQKLIYDVSEDKYLDTNAIQVDVNEYLHEAVHWSPDSHSFTSLIESLQSENSGLGLRKIAVFNLDTSEFLVLPGLYKVKNGVEWDWFPDGKAFAVNLEDENNTLIGVRLDGTQWRIADHVNQIVTTYNPGNL